MDNERTIQRRVGYVVIATAVIGTMLALNTSGPFSWTRGEYEIHILLNGAPGVGVNTPVQKNGVLIGRVKAVEETKDEKVLLTVSINKEWTIYSDDIVRVQPSSILGDAVVTFTRPPDNPPKQETPLPTPPSTSTLPDRQTSLPAPIQFAALGQETPPPTATEEKKDDPPRRVIQPGETITGVVVPSPVDLLINIQADVGPAIASLARAGDEVANLAAKIDKALGDNIEGRRIPELLDKTTVAMEDFSRTMKNVDAIVGDAQSREHIKATIANAEKLTAEARGTLADIQKTMKSLDGAVASLDRNMHNIEGLTEPIGKRGPELADLLISSLENFDIVMSDMKKFSYNLNSNEGTLGKLLTDPTLYNNINQAICNFDQRMQDITFQLRPILDDARVFSSKIAREPGRIIGGAVNPSIIR